MKIPKIFHSNIIAIHFISLLTAGCGFLVFFFSGEEITWLLWIIIPAAYIAIFSSFIVLPVAIFKGWKAIRDKKILMFLQYVVVSVMTAGITAGFIMVLFYSRGRH